MKKRIKLLVSALEPSANLHLDMVLDNLKEYELSGIFDKKFGTPLYPSSDFSVMGFLDVLPKIKKAKRAIKEMASLSEKADVVLLIDSPAFNLPLAKAIKEKNHLTKIVYYILPQVWAWKAKRVAKVEKYCDSLASILPFKQKFYNKALYVGHPLLDEIKEYKNGVTKNGIVAFLPGSRKSEIKSLIKIFKEAAKEIEEKKILVIPKHFSDEEIEQLYGDISEFEISKDVYKALQRSDFAFVCSGTATLESSLIGTPFVLVYKAKKFDYMIAKRFVKLKYVGLANIIFDFQNEPPLHNELLQDEVNAKNLLKEYNEFDRELFFKRSQELKEILKYGSASKVASLLSKL